MFSLCCSVEKRPRSQLEPMDAAEAARQHRQSLSEEDHDASLLTEEQQRIADEEEAAERRELEAREQEQARQEKEQQETEARKQRRAKERAQQQEAEEDFKRRVGEERRRAEEQAERTRKVKDFMMANGFGDDTHDINQPKTYGCCKRSKTYPLHLAARKGDEDMVRMILQAGAFTYLKDSGKRTPEAVARRCNKKGSHDGVVQLLEADAAGAQACSVGHADA